MIRLYPLILIGFLLFGCKSNKSSTEVKYPIITLEKTPCFGTCPAYQFKAYPDGTVTYEGKDYVKLIGKYKATLTLEELASFKAIFSKANYFSFANVYSAQITDLPTTYLYYDDGQQNKKIIDYYGAPASLKELEQALEDKINEINWQKVN